MKNKRTKRFNKLFAQLPSSIQEQAEASYRLFKSNPYHPSLHFKRIDAQAPVILCGLAGTTAL